MSVSITELILQVKTQPGCAVFPESSLFHSLPSLDLKGYQPDSFSYGFHLVSGFYSEKDHIASLDGWVPAAFCMRQQSGADIFSLSPVEEATVRLKYN